MSEEKAEYKIELPEGQEPMPDGIDPEAMKCETAERLTIARSQLMAIVQGLSGDVSAEFLIESGMVLTEIAQNMTMAAHFDIAMMANDAQGEIAHLKGKIEKLEGPAGKPCGLCGESGGPAEDAKFLEPEGKWACASCFAGYIEDNDA